MSFLLDTYERKGTDLTVLKSLLTEMDKHSYAITVPYRNIEIYHVMSSINEQKPDGTLVKVPVNTKEEIFETKQIRAYVFKPGDLFTYSSAGYVALKRAKINIKNIIAHPEADAIIDEILATKTLIRIGKCFCLTSDTLDTTLYQRVDMKGKAFTEHSFIRNLHVADLLDKDESATAIVRGDKGVYKLYSLLSSKFCYISQKLVSQIVEEIDPMHTMGKPVCNHWTLNNSYADVFVEFPEKAEELRKTYGISKDLVPGILISKSDIGFCAITIKGTWRYKNSISVFETVSKKHSGKFDVCDIIDDAKKKIFGKYTVLPERLCELMLINITDPVWKTTLKVDDARDLNKTACVDYLKKIFKEINLQGILQQKNTKMILEELSANIDPDMNYTAYDICMMVMELPSRVGNLNKLYSDMLMEAVSKAPYVEYTKKKPTSKVPVISIA